LESVVQRFIATSPFASGPLCRHLSNTLFFNSESASCGFFSSKLVVCCCLLCVCCVFAVCLLWVCSGFALGLLRVYSGLALGLLWLCSGLAWLTRSAGCGIGLLRACWVWLAKIAPGAPDKNDLFDPPACQFHMHFSSMSFASSSSWS
jgi:hypothetical protein